MANFGSFRRSPRSDASHRKVTDYRAIRSIWCAGFESFFCGFALSAKAGDCREVITDIIYKALDQSTSTYTGRPDSLPFNLVISVYGCI